MAQDLKIHSEWAQYTPKHGSNTSDELVAAVKSGCPFAHLFLQ
jgi:hypothetical protein